MQAPRRITVRKSLQRVGSFSWSLLLERRNLGLQPARFCAWIKSDPGRKRSVLSISARVGLLRLGANNGRQTKQKRARHRGSKARNKNHVLTALGQPTSTIIKEIFCSRSEPASP